MAVNINSQEFAEAWRLVSEALLAYIQKQAATDVPLPPKPEDITICKELYATRPIKQDDDTFIFKNFKETRQDGSMYKITLSADGSCDFELCDLQGEQRQIFKDNMANIMPPEVGSLQGEITLDNTICSIQKGKGVVEGELVKIIEPLVVEFKNVL